MSYSQINTVLLLWTKEKSEEKVTMVIGECYYGDICGL